MAVDSAPEMEASDAGAEAVAAVRRRGALLARLRQQQAASRRPSNRNTRTAAPF